MTFVWINVEKCVQFLRSVGVEVSPEQERAWMEAQKRHRSMEQTRRTKRRASLYECSNGHHVVRVRNRGQRRNSPHGAFCQICGGNWRSMLLLWTEANDGTITDYRLGDERGEPLPQHGQIL